MPKVIRTITIDNVDDIVRAHGTGAWYGTKENFSQASHVLVVRKGGGPALIAPIDDIVPVPDSGDKRWSFQFSHFARLGEREMTYHPDRSSNPAIVIELSSVLPDLSLEQLEWEQVAEKTLKWSFSDRVAGQPEAKKRAPRGITIAEAKQGLSVSLGVSEDQIDIIIRA